MTGREGALNPNLLIRRSRHIVQDRPLQSVCWPDTRVVRTGQALSSGLAAVLAAVTPVVESIPAISFLWKLHRDRPKLAGDGLRPARAGSRLALVC